MRIIEIKEKLEDVIGRTDAIKWIRYNSNFLWLWVGLREERWQ